MAASAPVPSDPRQQPAAQAAADWEQADLLALMTVLEAADPVATAPVATSPVATASDVAAPVGSASAVVPRPIRSPAAAALPPGEPEPCTPGQQQPAALGACPELVLILDTETTALKPDPGACIELGAILFHVPSRAVLAQVSFLIPCAANPAEAINGIPAAVSQLRQPWQAGLRCFEALLNTADAVLAHNAAFDRQWFGREPLPAVNKPWICSMDDIRWPADRNLRASPSVRDLALAYGVPVWAAHRALTDCIYLAQVFARCPDLEALLVAALEPRQLYRARVSYENRHLAREAGFRWNEPVPGAWSRRLSVREAAGLPFPVVLLENEALARSA